VKEKIEWFSNKDFKKRHAIDMSFFSFSVYAICGIGSWLAWEKDDSKPKCKNCLRILNKGHVT